MNPVAPPVLKNDRLLRALLRQPVDRTPVWMMRQAGRYLPEYRATRAKAGSFLRAVPRTPELACEVTLQPLDALRAGRGDPVLRHPHHPGRDGPRACSFAEGEGPQFERPVRTRRRHRRARRARSRRRELRYVMDAVRLIRRELDGRVPLIGFAGSPWTLATYMVEGGGSKDFAQIKSMLYDAAGARCTSCSTWSPTP